MARYVAPIMIAIGAVASIATSVAVPQVIETRPLPPVTLDDQVPTQTYAIRIQHSGSENISGSVTVHLDLRPALGSMPADLQITLANDDPNPSAPDQTDQRIVMAQNGVTVPVDLYVLAWSSCADGGECLENHTLTITRRDLLGDPEVEISGTVTVDTTYGTKEATPIVTLEVTPL